MSLTILLRRLKELIDLELKTVQTEIEAKKKEMKLLRSQQRQEIDELLAGLFQVTHALASVKSDLGALAGQVERLQTDLGLKDASVSDSTSFSDMRNSMQTPALAPEDDQIAAQHGGETLLPNYVPS